MKEKKRFLLLLGLIFVHLLLISIQVPKGSEPTYFERVVFSVFTPVEHGVVSFFRGLKNFWRNYFYFRDVQQQNQSLRDEALRLRQENLALKNLLLKFQGGKEIQELLSTVSRSILVASVIGIDSSQIYKSIRLNKGSTDGVHKDMVVLDRRGRLVGRIVEPVSPRESRVQLISDEDSGVGVLTERLRVVGILQGDSGGKCRLKYIIKTNREVMVDEEVLTSGLDGIYPSGIPVGRIVSITEDTDLFKKIIVEPYFDLSDLDQVAVFTADLRDLS
ncbi:MAG: rod shape-determining protein MreC [Candidatus Aminicenantes bacterium RBG_19FT_COMBO_58_17]|nr:MAG: rod shape-determining protein MreC [Candidatus Aminicenantes bacterium RBG_19FT_COMBO_58_17]